VRNAAKWLFSERILLREDSEIQDRNQFLPPIGPRWVSLIMPNNREFKAKKSLSAVRQTE
jgi:hypothetical protein